MRKKNIKNAISESSKHTRSKVSSTSSSTSSPKSSQLTAPLKLGRWNVETIVFSVLMLTMLISPYYRGLFFAENYLAFNLICTALFMVLLGARWFRKIGSTAESSTLSDPGSATWLPNRPIDYLFWLLPLAYLISMIGAVEPGLARNEFLRNFNYAVIAMIIIMTVKTRRQQQIAVLTFFLTTVWVSIFGYGVMFGIWEFTDGMTGTRLSSVFQYPNTLASFVGAGCLLGLFLLLYYMVTSSNRYNTSASETVIKESSSTKLDNTDGNALDGSDSERSFSQEKLSLIKQVIGKWSTWLIPLLLVAVTLLFSVMLHTGSRGGWLIFMVVYVASLLLAPLRQKLWYLIASVIGFGGGVYLYSLTNRLSAGIRTYEAAVKKSTEDPTMSLDPTLAVDYGPYLIKMLLLAAVLYGIGLICHLAYKWISQNQKRFHQGQWILSAVIVIIAIVGIALAPSILPDIANLESLEKVWQRFQTLQNIDSTISDNLRFTFNRDAMKIVRDYPIFGAGGGGWQGLFQTYQDHPYWSTQAHTYYMQLTTETGLFGILSLAVLLCGVAVVFVIAIRKADAANKLQLWGIAIALLMLLLHSAADFNMAYSSYGGYVWMLLALIVASAGTKHRKQIEQVKQANQNERTISVYQNTRFFDKLLLPVTNHSVFHWIQAVVLVLLVIVIFFVNVQPYNAINNYRKSAQLNQQEQTAKSFDAIRTAYRADGKNVDILVYYTDFLNEIVVSETKEDVKQQYSQELFAVLTKASEQFPYNTRIKNQLINMYFTHGYSVDAVNQLNQLIKIAPYTPGYYDRNIEYSYRLGLLYLEQKKGEAADQQAEPQISDQPTANPSMQEQQPELPQDQQTDLQQQARQYWQQAVDAYEQYSRLHQQIIEQQKPNEHQFRIQKATRLYTALAYYSLDQSTQADEILQTLMPDNPAWEELSVAIQEAVTKQVVTDEAIQTWLGQLP